MNPEQLQSKYTAMCMRLLVLEYAYRIHNDPWVGDLSFDAMQAKLAEVEQVFPELVHEKAPRSGYCASERSEDYPRSVRLQWTNSPEIREELAGQIVYTFDGLHKQLMAEAPEGEESLDDLF